MTRKACTYRKTGEGYSKNLVLFRSAPSVGEAKDDKKELLHRRIPK